MAVQNRTLACIFRFASAFVVALGLALATKIYKQKPHPIHFTFFTKQSNVWVLGVFLYMGFTTLRDIIKKGNKGVTTMDSKIRGSVTMAITITHLIWHFMLLPKAKLSSASAQEALALGTLQNSILHYFACWSIWIDYFFFTPKNSYKWYDPFLWLCLPYLYFAVTLIQAELIDVLPRLGSRYPYFFIDVDIFGFAGVLRNVAVISLGFLILGYAIYFIDKITITNGEICIGSTNTDKEKQE